MIEARLCQGPVVSIRVVRYFGSQSATGGNEQTWWCVVMCKAGASWGSSTRQPAAVAILPKKFGDFFESVAGHTLLALRISKMGLDWTRRTWMKYIGWSGWWSPHTTCGGEPCWIHGAMTGGQTPIPFRRFFYLFLFWVTVAGQCYRNSLFARYYVYIIWEKDTHRLVGGDILVCRRVPNSGLGRLCCWGCLNMSESYAKKNHKK